jgi:hypothetical protein
MGLKDTPWTRNVLALWWYTRCGSHDQYAIWLTLFADWSANTVHWWYRHSQLQDNDDDETNDNSSKSVRDPPFGYPPKFFTSYSDAWDGVTRHLQRHAVRIHQRWNDHSALSDGGNGGNGGGGGRPPPFPTAPPPTNTDLYDGGNFALTGTLTRPLELPNVLLIPIHPFDVPSSSDGTATTTFPPFIEKNKERGSMMVHSKKRNDICRHGTCWPFL